MTVAETIIQHLKTLPESVQAEVLDFVEYLENKTKSYQSAQEGIDWSTLSLQQAMRGMENEAALYSEKDIKDCF
ncbi:DUF2281 domain-containing protein [bacterium]|nr:DUF2281 domain-containing protein [bacterium]